MSDDQTPGFEVGHEFSFSRSFTSDDVARFAEVSEDFGRHHVEPDEQGRVMVHGLHTASLATQIGGSINYISRTMNFEFLAPVWSGDTVTCTATVEEAVRGRGKWRYLISFVYENQEGVTVLTGSSKGIVLDDRGQ